MPRANRLGVRQGILHVTHRCQNQEFHLRFARDRDMYREKMREALRLFPVALLDYSLTCNHVHLLVDAEDKEAVSGFMQKVAGEYARAYNRRKGRSDAVWGDSFHATLVDTGEYLQHCQEYIELNMVRCGVVKHPREWEWVGYHEIMGRRKRYRLLNLERLCWRLRTASLEDVRRNLEAALAKRIARDEIAREPCWTQSLAVGSASFVNAVKPLILTRAATEVSEIGDGTWALKEPETPYGRF